MAVPPAPVTVPSQRPLAPSVTSVTSVANDKYDNEMILGLCTDLLAFALQLKKQPKTSTRRPYDEGAVRLVIASNAVRFLQTSSYNRTARQEGRREELRKAREMGVGYYNRLH